MLITLVNVVILAKGGVPDRSVCLGVENDGVHVHESLFGLALPLTVSLCCSTLSCQWQAYVEPVPGMRLNPGPNGVREPDGLVRNACFDRWSAASTLA